MSRTTSPKRDASSTPGADKRFASARRLVTQSGDGSVDTVLAAAVVVLIGFGLVMVYSASSFEATVRFGDAQYYLKRQAIYAAMALIIMWLASRIDYHRLRPLTYPLLLVVAAMMVATIAGFGHRAGNAYRWLAVGPVHIQPSEVAKVVLVLWLAYSLSKKGDQVASFFVGFLPHLMVVGVFMVLSLRQPDFGSAVVLLTITFTMLFVAGVRFRYILSFSALFALGGFILVRTSEYRWGRFMSWLNMDEHRQGLAYQPFQSVMSFGSGGLLGLGLGRGLQVLYLPDAHTDFIASIIGEELGFVGLTILVFVFALVVWRGVKIATDAVDDYGAYIAFGISALLGMQVLTNLAVALAILPTKGLTLPFISYGGSSLLVSAGATGILLNISRCQPAPKSKRKESVPTTPAVVATEAQEAAW